MSVSWFSSGSGRRRLAAPCRKGPASVEAMESRQLFAAVTPVADAFVREGTFAGTNFGAANALFVKNGGGDTREAYLKFDVSSAGAVGSAVLRMDARLQNASTPDTRVGIFAVTETGWVEGNGNTTGGDGEGTDTDNNPAGELTFTNRPASSGPAVDIITIGGAAQQSYAFDVTNHVRAEAAAGRNVVAFVIRAVTAGNDWVSFVSREGGEFGPSLDVTAEAGPSATFAAGDVQVPADPTHTISITYADENDVEVLSITPDDITVTGPNGQALSVTGVSTSPTRSGTPMTAVYTVAAPGGSWDDADAGAYTVRLNAGQVSDTFENLAPPGELGTFDVTGSGPAVTAPTAAFTAPAPLTAAAPTHTFTVTYTDPDAVSRASIDQADVSVTGPGGATATVTAVSVNPNADGQTLTATYTVTGPGNAWDTGDNGTYTVSLLGDQVRDTGGAAAAAATLGTFQVNIADNGGGDPQRQLVGSFGQAGAARPTTLTFTEAGTVVTISIRGGGGQAFRENGAIELDLSNTSPASALTIRTRGGTGRVRIGDVTGGALRSITGRTADLTGAINLSGPLGTLALGNVNGGSLTVGGGGQLSMRLGDVTNMTVNSASPVRSISVQSWTDDAAGEDITAPAGVSTLSSRGGFGADLNVGSLGNLKAGGALTAANIRSAGSIRGVTAAAMSDSRIYAGVKADVSDLPDGADDFANASASIGSVRVRSLFSNSRVAAPEVGRVSFGTAQVVNGGNPFGVAGDRVAGVSGNAGGQGRLRLSRLDAPGDSLTEQDFSVKVI